LKESLLNVLDVQQNTSLFLIIFLSSIIFYFYGFC